MYVPGVLACSAHVEKGEKVAVSVAVEQPGADGGWVVGLTRGTVLQGSETGMVKSPWPHPLYLLSYSFLPTILCRLGFSVWICSNLLDFYYVKDNGVFVADPFYFERNGLYIGQGISMMSRAGMFRVPHGVALDLNNRVFNLPSFYGTVF